MSVPASRPHRRGGQGHRSARSDLISESFSPRHASNAQDESSESKALRAKFGPKLDALKELITDWTDEDLLFALNEASGDVDLAYNRISEGMAFFPAPHFPFLC